MPVKKPTPPNPFLLTGYLSPDYFCDREHETRSAIKTLVEKELVLDAQGAYQVYDRFFGLWLKSN